MDLYPINGIDDWLGPESTLNFFLRFIKMHGRGMKRAMILHGPPGNGKTSLVYAVARSLGLEVREVNGSLEVNKKYLERVFVTMSVPSLDDKKRILLFDESDAWSSRTKLLPYIQQCLVPVILTCNYLWKIDRELRESCEVIRIRQPTDDEKIEFATLVCKIHKIKYSDSEIEEFIESSRNFRSLSYSLVVGVPGLEEEDWVEDLNDITERHLVDGIPSDMDERTLAEWIYFGDGKYDVIHLLNKSRNIRLNVSGAQTLCEFIRTGVRSNKFSRPPWREKKQKPKKKDRFAPREFIKKIRKGERKKIGPKTKKLF